MSDIDPRAAVVEEALEARPVGPSWLEARRAEAVKAYQAGGFPARKQEDWKYTPLTRLSEAPLAPGAEVPADPEALAALGLEALRGPRLVFLQGRFAPELSRLAGLPEGAHLGSLAEALAAEDPRVEAHLAKHAASDRHAFRALNTALAADGPFLHLEAGVELAEPVHLVHLAAPGASYLRGLVVLEEGATATVVESFAGPAGEATLTDSVVEVVLGPGARLTQVTDQREGEAAFHVGHLRAELAERATWTHHQVNLGGRLVRREVEAALCGEEASVTLQGLSASRGEQHVENFTAIEHLVPRCTSREVYKAILDDKSSGVFRGRVVVVQDAQQTDSEQQNKNLLLSRDAEINTKPELEIYADDVKAAHGATIGQLAPEHLFFLRARGIDEATARRMLVHAFARDLLNEIELEAVREALDAAFSQRFEGEG